VGKLRDVLKKAGFRTRREGTAQGAPKEELPAAAEAEDVMAKDTGGGAAGAAVPEDLPSPSGEGGDGEPDAITPIARAEPPALVVLTDASIDAHVIMYHDPMSVQAEQYRACRTNILAMGRGHRYRSIAITSPVKGEGKSLSAVNLAICLAEAPGTRVCLLDTDFRAPRVQDLLGLGEGPGLSELLLDEADLNSSVLLETRVRDLHVIRAGRLPRNPAELLGSERIKNLLDVLKTDFTHVLCDTPPVNPYTDAAVLGARMDGVILVVRMNATEREQAEKAKHVLERAGANVLGLFITDAEAADTYEQTYS
jgi:capsular exopolysaccharide synthesis family protein